MSSSDLTTALSALNLCGGGDTVPPPSGTAAVTLDASDKDKYAVIAKDGLTASVGGPAWQNVRATVGAKEGKVYWELTVVEVTNPTGLVRIGWSTDSWAMDRQLGISPESFAFGGAGFKSNGGEFESYGEKFSKGDVVGALLEITADTETLGFSVNGLLHGDAFQQPRFKALFPAIALRNAVATVNFGARPWTHPPPEGFLGMDALPASARAAPLVVARAGAEDGGGGDPDPAGGGGGGDERGSVMSGQTAKSGAGSGTFWERRSIGELRPKWDGLPPCRYDPFCSLATCRYRHTVPPGQPLAGPGGGGAGEGAGGRGGGGGGGGKPPPARKNS